MKKVKLFNPVVLGFLLLFTQTGSSQDLLEIYSLAQENDPLLKQSLANLQAVSENRPQSIARLLPSISVKASKSRDRFASQKNTFQTTLPGIINEDLQTQEFWNQSFSLDLTQPIFHWDHWVKLSQSDNLIAQADADYMAEQQRLITRTVEAYFNILSAQDNLEFTKAEKNAIARQLDQAQQRFEVGLIAITDVYEAQAGFDRARADEVAALNDLDNAKEALREIIGDRDVSLDKLGDKLPLKNPNPDDIETWGATAEESNLSIISAQNKAEYARKTIELQRSGHYPQIDLVASYGESDVDSSSGFDGRRESVGLQLNLPLFEGGAVISRTQQAHHEYQKAKEQLVVSQRAVKRQVRDAYRGVLSSISRVNALKATLKSSESALEATEAGFEVGTRTMVDVLVEQRNLFRSKRDYARARYDYLINGIKLKQSASNLVLEDLESINRLLL